MSLGETCLLPKCLRVKVLDSEPGFFGNVGTCRPDVRRNPSGGPTRVRVQCGAQGGPTVLVKKSVMGMEEGLDHPALSLVNQRWEEQK